MAVKRNTLVTYALVFVVTASLVARNIWLEREVSEMRSDDGRGREDYERRVSLLERRQVIFDAWKETYPTVIASRFSNLETKFDVLVDGFGRVERKIDLQNERQRQGTPQGDKHE